MFNGAQVNLPSLNGDPVYYWQAVFSSSGVAALRRHVSAVQSCAASGVASVSRRIALLPKVAASIASVAQTSRLTYGRVLLALSVSVANLVKQPMLVRKALATAAVSRRFAIATVQRYVVASLGEFDRVYAISRLAVAGASVSIRRSLSIVKTATPGVTVALVRSIGITLLVQAQAWPALIRYHYSYVVRALFAGLSAFFPDTSPRVITARSHDRQSVLSPDARALSADASERTVLAPENARESLANLEERVTFSRVNNG